MESFQQDTSQAQLNPFRSTSPMPITASKPSFNWSGHNSNSIASYAEESPPLQSKDTKSVSQLGGSNLLLKRPVASSVFDQTKKTAGEVKFSECKANMFLDTAAGSSQGFGVQTSSSIPGDKITFPAATVSASSSPLSRTSLDSASTLSSFSPSVSSSSKDSGTFSWTSVYFV